MPVRTPPVRRPTIPRPLVPLNANTTLLIISDSLGVLNQHGNLFGRFAQEVGKASPALSIVMSAWNATTGAYDPPITVQTGYGPYTLTIWLFAVGGSQPQRAFGTDRALGFDPITPDVILWHHGKNVSAEQTPDGRMQSAYEMARLAKPNAVHVSVLQPPNQVDDKMTAMNAAIQKVAGEYGDVPVIDCFSAVLAEGKPAYLYDTPVGAAANSDNLHPSDYGVVRHTLPDLLGGFFNASRPATIVPARMATQGKNYLANGDFSTWTAAVPASWTTAGNVASVAKDTGNKLAGRPYSLKMTQSATGGTMRQTFTALAPADLAALAGQYLWYAYWSYIPFGTDASNGLVQLTVVDEIGTLNLSVQHTFDQRPGAEPSGAWALNIGRTQRALGQTITAASSSLKLYCSSTTVGATAWFDRIVMGIGTIPNDMAFATG